MGTSPISSGDIAKALEKGRPSNIKRPFPNSRALDVGRKSRERVPIPTKVREEVLYECRHRCAICYAFYGDISVKHGQIVHLDHNRKNPKKGNLVFLCQECHASYDSKSNRVLGLTPDEVKVYRDLLHKKLYQDLPF